MKKRLSAFLMLFLLMLPSFSLSGETLRGFDSGDGYQYVAFGAFCQQPGEEPQPILWRVLETDGENACLLSEYILFGNRIDPDDTYYQEINGEFCQTELFRLLNGPFEGDPISPEEQEALNEIERLGYAYIAETCFADTAFTPEEQLLIYEDEALGKVYILSAEDLKNPALGFSSSRDRQAYGTEYAYSTGLFEYGNGTSPYWTRSQSVSYPYAARCTKVEGDLGYIRCVVMNEGCRPAIRLQLEKIVITGGDGSRDNPYLLGGK